MKKLLLLFTILMTAMLGTSCLSDDLNGGGKNPTEGSFLLSLDIQDGVRNMRSTVAAEPGESDVQTLHLLFFEASGDQEFVEFIVLENEDVNVPLRMSTPIRVDFTGRSLNPVIVYRILIVANIGNYVGDLDNWLASFQGTTYRDAENAVLNINLLIGQGVSPQSLLMSATARKELSQDVVSATLMRGVTRFDVQINPDVSVLGYSLAEASVWNVPTVNGIWNPARNDYGTHTRRFNGIFVEESTGFRGGLYAFENNVTSSAQNDTKTTCLILGIRDASNVLTYYRVNVNVAGAAQFLQRNHVYNVVVTGIRGPGAATEEEAYTGAVSLLDVSFNSWNMENMGLIMYDGENIMAVPTNRITFGAGGGSNPYLVFTYSPDPNLRLTISRSELPAGITANLLGNSLTVSAEASTDAKNGFIELAFGNLRSVIEISQVGYHEEYLILKMLGRDEEMGINDIPEFPSTPVSGMPGNVQVNASGNWIARIHNPGFTFESGNSAATRIEGVPGGTFTVATTGTNTEPIPKYAFIVVMLAENPDISQVLVLSQSGAGRIDLTPEYQTAINFNANGGAIGNNVFNANSHGLPITVQIAGTHAAFFRYEIENLPDGTRNITVLANGINMSGNIYEATLRMFITGQLITERTIPIRQATHSLTVSTPTTSVATAGGLSQNIIVTSSVPWTATVATISGSAPDGRRLVRHEATLEDQYGNPIVPGTEYNDNTQLRVRFPKVYYPNRQIPISANVTVSIGGLLSKTVSVTQVPLNDRGFTSQNLIGTTWWWGALSTTGDRYFQAWAGAVQAVPGHRHIGSMTGDGLGSLTAANAAVNSETTYLHVTAHGAATFNNWAVVTNFMDADRGWTVISVQGNLLGAINNATSPIRRAGYNNLVFDPDASNANIFTGHSNTKVYQFLMERGNTSLSINDPDITNFWNDGINTSIPGPWPNSAVVLMTKLGRAQLLIDIENRFLYIGESQIFWYVGMAADALRPWGQRYLDNLMYFLGNASRYGTHFTDMLLEEVGPAAHPNAQPAPWDDVWGDNRGGRPGGNGVGSK
jgi:hypothetical protein